MGEFKFTNVWSVSVKDIEKETGKRRKGGRETEGQRGTERETF